MQSDEYDEYHDGSLQILRRSLYENSINEISGGKYNVIIECRRCSVNFYATKMSSDIYGQMCPRCKVIDVAKVCFLEKMRVSGQPSPPSSPSSPPPYRSESDLRLVQPTPQRAMRANTHPAATTTEPNMVLKPLRSEPVANSVTIFSDEHANERRTSALKEHTNSAVPENLLRKAMCKCCSKWNVLSESFCSNCGVELEHDQSVIAIPTIEYHETPDSLDFNKTHYHVVLICNKCKTRQVPNDSCTKISHNTCYNCKDLKLSCFLELNSKEEHLKNAIVKKKTGLAHKFKGLFKSSNSESALVETISSGTVIDLDDIATIRHNNKLEVYEDLNSTQLNLFDKKKEKDKKKETIIVKSTGDIVMFANTNKKYKFDSTVTETDNLHKKINELKNEIHGLRIELNEKMLTIRDQKETISDLFKNVDQGRREQTQYYIVQEPVHTGRVKFPSFGNLKKMFKR